MTERDRDADVVRRLIFEPGGDQLSGIPGIRRDGGLAGPARRRRLWRATRRKLERATDDAWWWQARLVRLGTVTSGDRQ